MSEAQKELNDKIKLDIVKLHNEINISINMRLLVSAAAVTVILKGVDNLLNYFPPSSIEESIKRTFTMAWPWVVVFSLLCGSREISKRIYLIASYLRVNKLSQWEEDWMNFKNVQLPYNIAKMRVSILGNDVAGANLLSVVSFVSIIIQCNVVFFNQQNGYWILPFCMSLLLIVGVVVLKIVTYKSDKFFNQRCVCVWCRVLKKYQAINKCMGDEMCMQCIESLVMRNM